MRKSDTKLVAQHSVTININVSKENFFRGQTNEQKQMIIFVKEFISVNLEVSIFFKRGFHRQQRREGNLLFLLQPDRSRDGGAGR